MVCRSDLEDQCRYCLSEGTGEEEQPQERSTSSASAQRSPTHVHHPPPLPARRLPLLDTALLSEDLQRQAQRLECPVVKGVCHHIFHVHCLQAWFQRSKICPLCGAEWRAASIITTTLPKPKSARHHEQRRSQH